MRVHNHLRSKQMKLKKNSLSASKKIMKIKPTSKKIRIVLRRKDVLDKTSSSGNELCHSNNYPEYHVIEKFPLLSENLENHNIENCQQFQDNNNLFISSKSSESAESLAESGVGSSQCGELTRVHSPNRDDNALISIDKVDNNDDDEKIMSEDDDDDFESFSTEYDNQFAAAIPTMDQDEHPNPTSCDSKTSTEEGEEEVLEEIIEDVWDVTLKEEKGAYKMKFLVKWDGWAAKDNTDEPFEHVSHAEVLHDYVKRKFEFHADRIQAGIDKLCSQAPDVAEVFKRKSRKTILKKYESLDMLYFKCSILAYIYTYTPVPLNCAFVRKLIYNCFIYKAMQTKEMQEKYHEQKTNELMTKDENIVSLRIENKVDFATIPNFVYLKNVEDLDRKLESVGCSCENGCDKKSECCPNQLVGLPTVFDNQGLLTATEHQLIVECSEFCNCDITTCTNHIVRPHLKLCIFKTNRRGWGLRTLEYIPAGSFVIEYTGELITAEDAKKRTTHYKKKGISDQFMFDLDYNEKNESFYSIDATMKGNLSRFINHSCNANLQTWPAIYRSEDKYKHRLYYFALRAIRANEELTIDYFGGIVSTSPKKVPVNAKPCRCESVNCRGLIF